jgi:hypothetical protein
MLFKQKPAGGKPAWPATSFKQKQRVFQDSRKMFKR